MGEAARRCQVASSISLSSACSPPPVSAPAWPQDAAQETEPLPTADDEYRFKYSGGCATYPHQLIPFAYHSTAANTTFFVYGGSSEDGSLLHMVSYFDHATGTVPRPRVLLDKHTGDAHDNPTLMLGAEGYLWIFSTGTRASAHRAGSTSAIARAWCISCPRRSRARARGRLDSECTRQTASDWGSSSICMTCSREIETLRSNVGYSYRELGIPISALVRPTMISSGWRMSNVRPSVSVMRNGQNGFRRRYS